MAFLNYLLSFGWLADKAWNIVSGLFKSIYDSITAPFRTFKSFKTLVFGKEDSDLVYNTFRPNEVADAIAPGVAYMSYLVGFILMFGIIYMGIKIATGALNPSNRTMFIEYIRDWLFVAVVLFNLGFFYEMVFMFNGAIISILKGDLIKNLNDSLTPEMSDSGIVGWIIIGLFMLGITIWANWYYLMRKITLMILMVLGPIFIALFVFPSTKKITLAWFREFFGTVMIQSVHAVTIWIIATLAQGSTESFFSGTPVIEVALMYLIVIPAGEAVRGLFNLGGDSANNISRFGAMAGMGALAGIGASIKSMRDGTGLVDALRNGGNAAKGAGGVDPETGAEKAVGNGTGPISGTDQRASRMMRAGEITSKAGKAVFGIGGSIAGAATGRNGALIGAGIGVATGATLGGAAGRLGYAGMDLAKNGLEKAKNGLNQGIDGFSDEQEADSIADSLATKQTDEWAKANKDAFMEKQKSLNPELANNPKALEKMWQNKLGEQRKAFKQQNKDMLLAGKMDPNYAKASDLAESMAQEKLAQDLKENGRDAFVSKLDKDMPQEQVEKAWQQEKDRRLSGFRKEANAVAKKVTGNKPLDSYIDKDQFLAAYSANEMDKVDAGKDQFLQNYATKNPTATKADGEQAWKAHRENQADKINTSAGRISSKTPSIADVAVGPDSARASDLIESAAGDMTKAWVTKNVGLEVEKQWSTKVNEKRGEFKQQAEANTAEWAKANEQSIKASLLEENPNRTPAQLDQAFGKVVQGKLSENLNAAKQQGDAWAAANQKSFKHQATQEALSSPKWADAKKQEFAKNVDYVANAVKPVTGDNSVGAIVNKQDFAKALEGHRIEQAKQSFGKANGLQGAQLDKAFEEKGIGRVIQQEVRGSVGSMPQMNISKGFANREALAVQYASQMTDNWAKANYSQFEKDFGQNPQFANLKGQDYQNTLQAEWGKAVQGNYNKNITDANKVIANNSGNGVVLPDNVGGLIAGVKGFTTGFADGAGISSNARQAKQEAFEQLPPAEKMLQHRNKVAYRHGVLSGVNGYQKGARKAMMNNPYMDEYMDGALELGDIAKMAKTETVNLPNGETINRVAKGAVQLIVEKDRSYVQVQKQNGEVQTVSHYGAGDSSLQDGQTLFKDYTIDDSGHLAPVKTEGNKTGFYTKDTSGAKIASAKMVNIDANQLVANRRQISNAQLEPRHDAYNYKVETGQFNMKDIQTHNGDPSQKVVLVTEKDRSYVAMKGEDKKMYRVSEVKNTGNPNLQEGQTVYKEYVVEGGQLRERSMNKNVQLETYMYSAKGERIRVDSSRVPDEINVNELIPPAPNKRYEQRKKIEQRRVKSGAY